jgi:membrane fusion protein (multidrug efflux system)
MIRQIALGLLALLLVASACGKDDKEAERQARAETAPVPVVVDTARVGALPVTTHATGQVAAWQEVPLVAQVEGPVIRAPEKEGVRFGRGQVVYEIDPVSYRLDAERARLEVEKAQAEYDFELRNREGEITDDVRQMIKIATGLKEAELGLAQAEQALKNAVIRAPFDCSVAGLTARKGGIVYRGDQLCRLVDTSRIKVAVSVGEAEAARIVEGAAAWVSVPALGDEERTGSVHSISPVISPDTRGCDVEVALSDAGNLKPGMYAKVRILVEEVPDAVMVPEPALLIRSERPLVFVIRDGLAKWEYVTLGARGDGIVQIVDGVAPNELVITEGHFALAHDAPVVPIPGETTATE